MRTACVVLLEQNLQWTAVSLVALKESLSHGTQRRLVSAHLCVVVKSAS